ncbi:MAG: cation transporter [Firmicutes bacterium]|nr:cation transporter [Bacillota bacterium]MBR5488165.1 cation transporter [Bacillota bacterium]
MKKTFLLEGLCCANCAAKIETGIKKLDGIDKATISFLTSKLVIETAEEPSKELLKKIEKTVHKVEPDVEMKEI